LADEGALVGVVGRDRGQAQRAASELSADRAMAIPADVSDPEQCLRAVAEFEGQFGHPSLLINAAGISPVLASAGSLGVDTFQRIVSVNLAGAFAMTQAALPALTQTQGAVVMIASTTGLNASPRLAGYGASKAGLIHLTRTLAREWAELGVRVNAVCPGYVETDLTRGMLANERLRAGVLADTPMARLGTLAEVVAPTLFLASEEASYITGAVLAVDGGMQA
jgi:NAD(P)-dependent dehydrogenase (short-subunit alcohol dehydrogenase family)